MKFISKIKYLLLLVAILLGMPACVDEFEQPELIGDGTASIEFAMNYKQIDAASLGETRSQPGDLIGDIKNGVFVVWYKNDGTFAGCKYYDNDQLTISDVPRDNTADCDVTTQRATFNCDIPYGRYRIYTAVNMGDLEATHNSAIQTEAGFKAIQFNWDNQTIANNCQMAGYFTTTRVEEYANEAPLLTINQPDVSLHAWVRRAASKVTVAFDASDLNDNIYIYLKHIQIKDIPNSCLLLNKNTPTAKSQLIEFGDSIQYGKGNFGADNYLNWPRLSCGREAAKYGSHAADAPALFFYENMQGTHPDKHKYTPGKDANGAFITTKDNVPLGTYLEVEAYYVNHTNTDPSHGKIIYRCMLGKNMTDDFNSERNVHYKVTLKFNNDANDVDWHIDYEYIPQPPEIIVPTPQFISYQYSRDMHIPVAVRYDPVHWEVVNVVATITANESMPKTHKYYSKTKDHEIHDGFLSLKKTDPIEIKDNEGDFMPTKTFTSGIAVSDSLMQFDIPVYTRTLMMEHAYSGYNIWTGSSLNAVVHMKAQLYNRDTKETRYVEQDVDVIQVRRLLNPTGVWRKANSTKPFRVRLTESNVNESSEEMQEFSLHLPTEYHALVSNGPWTAEIIDGKDWVQIKDAESGTWSNTPVTGGTGSEVTFDYRPGSTTTDGNPRFGVIRVAYHNNNCIHLIMVSQGMGTVQMEPGGPQWCMSNVKYAGVDEANPLLEGSMFKYGQVNYAIASTNSMSTAISATVITNSSTGATATYTGNGYGYNVGTRDKLMDYYDANGGFHRRSICFENITIPEKGTFNVTAMKKNGRRVSKSTDWATIDVTHNDIEHLYGVLYGEECSETQTATNKTTTYTAEGQEAGMLGIFIITTRSGYSGRHLFFPMGNTCYGRRKYIDQYSGTPAANRIEGNIKYSDRTIERPDDNLYPLYYLYRSPGAIYWFDTPIKNGVYYQYGWDINYMTFGFEVYNTDYVRDGLGPRESYNKYYSDACFIRRVVGQ